MFGNNFPSHPNDNPQDYKTSHYLEQKDGFSMCGYYIKGDLHMPYTTRWNRIINK